MPPTSAASRSFPTLRYLVAPIRWLFASRQRVLTASAVLVAILAAPAVWWSIQLVGLPDIGDPFDPQALRSMAIPEERNAFVLYRRAIDRISPMDQRTDSASRADGPGPVVPGLGALTTPDRSQSPGVFLLVAWSKADPRARRLLEQNREAMDLYRRGSELPDAFDPARDGARNSREWWDLRTLHLLALLEASRLEERGDMAGAWAWYRAALRAAYHFGRYGYQTHRSVALFWRGEIQARLSAWAADPRTTPELIRRALDDVLACEALAPSETYTIEAEYPDILRQLDSPNNPGRVVPLLRVVEKFGIPSFPVERHQVQGLLDAWRWWRREPERSRRVIRLAVANWLAYEELPPGRRPKPDPDVPGPLRFYALGPDSPAKARALSPVALDGWLASTTDADPILKDWNPWILRSREARSYRAMVVLLASELYRRDRGTEPLWDEDLVGPYLKELPDDGLGGGTSRPGPSATSTRLSDPTDRGD